MMAGRRAQFGAARLRARRLAAAGPPRPAAARFGRWLHLQPGRDRMGSAPVHLCTVSLVLSQDAIAWACESDLSFVLCRAGTGGECRVAL